MRQKIPKNMSKGVWKVRYDPLTNGHLAQGVHDNGNVDTVGAFGLILTWEVEDIIAARNLMISSGIKPSEISRHPWGAMVFYLRDPEGHRIEIGQTEHPSNVLNENKGNQ